MNCTRLKSRSSAAASAFTSSVLATPGTPSSSTWPRTSSAATSRTACPPGRRRPWRPRRAPRAPPRARRGLAGGLGQAGRRPSSEGIGGPARCLGRARTLVPRRSPTGGRRQRWAALSRSAPPRAAVTSAITSVRAGGRPSRSATRGAVGPHHRRRRSRRRACWRRLPTATTSSEPPICTGCGANGPAQPPAPPQAYSPKATTSCRRASRTLSGTRSRERTVSFRRLRPFARSRHGDRVCPTGARARSRRARRCPRTRVERSRTHPRRRSRRPNPLPAAARSRRRRRRA